MTSFVFDVERLVTVLEEHGYDTQVEHNLVYGRRDRAATTQVWVDAGGRVRFQMSRQGDAAQTVRVERDGRVYRVLHEQQSILNIIVTLDTVEQFASALPDLENIDAQLPAADDTKVRSTEDTKAAEDAKAKASNSESLLTRLRQMWQRLS